MDYVTEAKKWVWRAQESGHPDDKVAHLKMAEWCLSKATEERGDDLS
jgi:hypothetical protein